MKLYPPFVWPEPCVLERIKPLECSKNDKEIASKAQSIFGVLSGLNLDGVNYLKGLLENNSSLKCRLLVVLYPACVTSKSVLTELESVMNANAETAVFRLFVVHSMKDSPSNALCYLAETMPPVFTIGGSHNLGSGGIVAQPNFTFYGDGALVDSWSNWFNWAWSKSVRLDSETASIPPLMAVQLMGEEDRLWQNYTSRCHMIPADSPSLEAKVNEHTGNVAFYNSVGTPVATPTEELGCIAMDADVSELVSKLQALYRRGALMTIDKTSRLKPFDTPINPRWFGMDSLRTVGTVTRTVSYRISAFDKTTLTKLNNLRIRANDLLSKFTFPLSDGVRWMPDGVRKLFFDEMKRSDEAGRKRFDEICGTDPEEFVNKKARQIEEDANRIYQELRPNQFLESSAIEEILGTLKDRLKEAKDGPFTPKVTSSIVSFEYQDESDHTSAWGQALTLLCAIADFPRRCVSDRYFMRGLSISEKELLTAMNVLDDAFVQGREARDIVSRAEEELQTLQDIMQSQAEPQNRCKAILKLISGSPRHEIVVLLPDITTNMNGHYSGS